MIYDEARAESGKRVPKWRGGFATKREAEAFLASTVSKIGDGSDVAPSKITFGEYLDQWIEDVADSLRPLTLTKYCGVIRGHLKPNLHQVHLQALKRSHFTRLHRELREAGKAPATIAVVHAVAHSGAGRGRRSGSAGS